MKLDKLIVVFTILLAITIAGAAGSGTAEDPYQISTRAELEAVNNDLTACYILTNDIDLSGYTYEKAVISYDTDADEAFDGVSFTGTFNGNGFRIIGLTINADNHANVGLLGRIGAGASVSNLNISSCSIFCDNNYVGALAGKNAGTITGCASTGTVSTGEAGGNYIGGLTGRNAANIENCFSSVSISGTSSYIGGLTGISIGFITQCVSTGEVSGYSEIGGLCGNNTGNITKCYSAGSATGLIYNTGGFCGNNSYGTIENCYSTSSVNGFERVGGFAGASSYGTISNCYSTGSVTGDQWYTSGFCNGATSASFTSCYWDTQTSGMLYSKGATGLTTAQMHELTSFIGWDFAQTWIMNGYPKLIFFYNGTVCTVTFAQGEHGTIAPSESVQSVIYGSNAVAPVVTPDDGYAFTGWDIDFNNVTDNLTVTAQYLPYCTVTFVAGEYGTITGGDAVQILDYGTSATAPIVTPTAEYSHTGWDNDFSNVTSNITVTALYGMPELAGSGTAEDPYQIDTKEDLEAVNLDLEASYVLLNDIDLSYFTFDNAVIAYHTDSGIIFYGTPFTGTFNGNGHKITGLTINSTLYSHVGLFGDVGSGGLVRNLNIEDCSITSLHERTGSLCSSNLGVVLNCHTSGSVSGTQQVGGFCGAPGGKSGIISNCSSSNTVTGTTEYIGGFCGAVFRGKITNCQSTGDVTATQSGASGIGGFSGHIGYECTISNSQSTGDVTAINGAIAAGGFCGENGESSILNCYSRGNISVTGNGIGPIGGFCGDNIDGNISNCYSTGSIDFTDEHPGAIGGFCAANTYGVIENSFWDTDSSGMTIGIEFIYGDTTDNTAGLTTAQMQVQSNFTGWDFYGEDENGTDEAWIMPQEAGYPMLVMSVEQTADIYADGSIDAGDLMVLSENWLSADCLPWDFCGSADIDLDGKVDITDFAAIASRWLMDF